MGRLIYVNSENDSGKEGDFLEKTGEYLVTKSNSISYALALNRQLKADIFVLRGGENDNLPFQVQRLRSNGCLQPIVILEKNYSAESIIESVLAGANDVIKIPSSETELYSRLKAVEQLSREKSLFCCKILQFADLRLNLAERIAERNGKIINLSSLDFGVLEYFMRHHDAIISINALMKAIWGYVSPTSTNVVAAAICRLKHKIDMDDLPSLLHNVYSRGYVMKVDTSRKTKKPCR